MTKLCLRWSALLCGLVSVPLLAHHGTSNYSTTAQTITLSGTVTEFVWSNPHVYVLFDVKDAAGNAGVEREPCRIVSAVLEAAQSLDEDGRALLRAYVADDPAHA